MGVRTFFKKIKEKNEWQGKRQSVVAFNFSSEGKRKVQKGRRGEVEKKVTSVLCCVPHDFHDVCLYYLKKKSLNLTILYIFINLIFKL